jgi:hypothetical protein
LRISGGKTITIKDPTNLVSSPCGSVLPSSRSPPFPSCHTDQREQISEEIQKPEEERWGDSPADDFPFRFALTNRSKRSVRLVKELSRLRGRALGLMEEKLMMSMWKRNGGQTVSVGLGSTGIPHEVGPTLITVAAITVAIKDESCDWHNFLTQNANYACE